MLDQCSHRPEPYTAHMGHDRNVTRRDAGIPAGEDRRRGIRQLSAGPDAGEPRHRSALSSEIYGSIADSPQELLDTCRDLKYVANIVPSLPMNTVQAGPHPKFLYREPHKTHPDRDTASFVIHQRR